MINVIIFVLDAIIYFYENEYNISVFSSLSFGRIFVVTNIGING